MEIGKRYLDKLISDFLFYLGNNFEIRNEKHPYGKPYSCYICLKSLNEEHILIKELTNLQKTERRYHENCLKKFWFTYTNLKSPILSKN